MPPTQNKLIRKMSSRTFPRLCTTAYTLKTWKLYYTYQGQRGKFTKQCFCTVSGQPPPCKKASLDKEGHESAIFGHCARPSSLVNRSKGSMKFFISRCIYCFCFCILVALTQCTVPTTRLDFDYRHYNNFHNFNMNLLKIRRIYS